VTASGARRAGRDRRAAPPTGTAAPSALRLENLIAQGGGELDSRLAARPHLAFQGGECRGPPGRILQIVRDSFSSRGKPVFPCGHPHRGY